MKVLLIFTSLIISTIGYSQAHRFKYITSADGISQSEVYSFLEDSQGYMWFGTVDGLNRYDGYRVTIFNTEKGNPNSIINNTIRSLAEDSLGRVWIGTDNGLSLYDPASELIHQIKIAGFENSMLSVFSILIDGNKLYLASSGGLLRAEITENIELEFEVIENVNPKSYSFQKGIVSIKKSNNGSIWVLAHKFISRIVVQPGSNKAIKIDEQIFYDFYLVDFTEDKYGVLWITSAQNGLVRYTPDSKQLKWLKADNTNYSISSNKCSSLQFDNEGNLWVATRDRGLNFLQADMVNKNKVHFDHIQHDPFNLNSLNSNLIYSLYVSKDNLLWVGTIGSGVNVFDPEQKGFSHYKIQQSSINTAPVSNFVRAVYAGKDGRIWVGTHNNGLFILDRGTGVSQKLSFGTQAVFFISAYKGDKVFIGSSKGLFLVQLKGNNLNILSYLTLPAVFNVVKSRNNTYWSATVGSLVRIKVISGQLVKSGVYTTETNPAISFNNCRVLLYDKNRDELLVGTEGGGLNVVALDEDQFAKSISVYKKSKQSNSISNNYVRSIFQDSNNNIWVGTYEGLNKIIRVPGSCNLSFEPYSKNNGLPNNMIQLITEDNKGNLWIGTNGGLSKFNPQSNQFTNFTISDGIQSNEFSEHTVFKKTDGEIILGGINGINTFYPEKIKTSRRKPKTTITNFYIFNKRVHVNEKFGGKVPLKKGITLTDTIELMPGQNSIRFDFTAMLFPNSEKIQYAYMLEGFDKDWQFTDFAKRNASYTNLKHGKYVFKVKSTNSDGIWENNPRTIFIHIKTPFVYTWIAYVMYIISIILVFVYFTRFTVIKYTTKKQLLLENEHNRKLQELNNLRTKFFINISHDLRTPLTLISGPLEKILKTQFFKPALKSQLKLINRNVKRLKYLIEQLLDNRRAEMGKLKVKLHLANIVDFVKEEAKYFEYAIQNKGLVLNVISDRAVIVTNFDSDIMSKMIFNLLSNAVKFTENGGITIRIERVAARNIACIPNTQFTNFVKIEFQDTGQGIADDKLLRIFDRFYQDESASGKGYGIGLSHCKELIEAHSGKIEVESKVGVGTIVRLYIPDIETTGQHLQKGEAMEYSLEDIYVDTGTSPGLENSQTISDSYKTILIVEDNADMRIFIRNELQSKYKIYEAEDGITGLGKAENYLPDLIISDIMMPNMDGIEFCKQIKTNIKTSHIPVILLTAKVDRETKYQSIETGADDYISKPFEMEYLVLRINNLLTTREQLRKLFQKNSSLELSAITVTSIDEKFLSLLLTTLEKGISDPGFNINALEYEMGMSHANFYRKVKSLTGQSGKEILQEMRMKRAMQLLSDNKNIRVSEVAFMVGFADPKYFSKCFKEKFGVAPMEFRGDSSQ
ncbi:MAG: response regulator [Draconibacterium sp.]|nr:response regulator [Draconibacterium sp.]